MTGKQLSLFPEYDDAIVKSDSIENNRDDDEEKKKISLISGRIFDEFSILQIPFIGCDFDLIYPKIAKILPSETINFCKFGFEANIACELICAAICHQINWDFLRQAVFIKTEKNINWLSYENLCRITEEDIAQMLKSYNKPDRIRAGERAALLREVGEMVEKIGGYKYIFLDDQMNLLSNEKIRDNFSSCQTFSQDPSEKKLQLLLQKLSSIKSLKGLALYYQPAIDYHLIRCYLRRGLIYPTTQYAANFIKDISIQRRESTVGAMRQLCSELMQQICWFTSLDINTINLVEWHIGRSICTEDNPDCSLKGKDAVWIKKYFSQCPFYENCVACNYIKDYHTLQGPSYKGTSY